MFNKLLKPKEAAELLNVSSKTLANHRALGSGLPYFKINGEIRYKIDAVERYINKNTHGENIK